MRLLEPISIGQLDLKNRIVMAPMGPGLESFSPRANDYYLRRARGGVAMIFINILVTQEFEGQSPSSILDEASYPGFKDLVEGCHREGCKVCVQLMPGTGLGLKASHRKEPVSASSLPSYIDPRVSNRALDQEEIDFIQKELLKTALLAKKAGADAVELHAYGGYLTDQFMTERWNTREDKYGGCFENRMRFLMELVDLLKIELGENFPLIVKYTPDHYIENGYGYRVIIEGIQIARYLEDRGVDALHIDAGCHDNWDLAIPPIYQQGPVAQLESSRLIKEHVGLPIISQGRLSNIEKAEASLREDCLDIVALGRGLLADPDLVRKLEDHRPDEIRHCIYCNEGCIQSVSQGRPIDCAVNPETGYEGLRSLKKTSRPQDILVIGAGPAGASAAIFAHQAGHRVEVWEERSLIGGNFHQACQPSFKRDGGQLLDYYRTMFYRLGLDLKLNKQAQVEDLLALDKDLIINATGARLRRPSLIAGLDGPNVVSSLDVLNNSVPLGDKVVILGGGLVGVETGLYLEGQGKDVTLLEMGDRIVPEGIWGQNLMMLYGLIKKSQLRIMTGCQVRKISGSSVYYESGEGPGRLHGQTVVLALGMEARDELYQALRDQVNIVNIGDSREPGKVFDSVHEAYKLISDLG